MEKRVERLMKLTKDCQKNSNFEDSPDGFIKVTLPTLGIVTWVKDLEDAKIAITEAVKCFEIMSDKFGEGFETELDRAEMGLYINWVI